MINNIYFYRLVSVQNLDCYRNSGKLCINTLPWTESHPSHHHSHIRVLPSREIAFGGGILEPSVGLGEITESWWDWCPCKKSLKKKPWVCCCLSAILGSSEKTVTYKLGRTPSPGTPRVGNLILDFWARFDVGKHSHSFYGVLLWLPEPIQ